MMCVLVTKQGGHQTERGTKAKPNLSQTLCTRIPESETKEQPDTKSNWASHRKNC